LKNKHSTAGQKQLLIITFAQIAVFAKIIADLMLFISKMLLKFLSTLFHVKVANFVIEFAPKTL
jgi:hypothetical protein